MLATVIRTERLTPRMVRVVLGGPDLASLHTEEFTDAYVKLLFPPPGAAYEAPFDVEDVRARHPREEWPRTRTYTLREWDSAAGELTIDFVVHGDSGVAGPWAEAAEPGAKLQIRDRSGGAYSPGPEFGWHLMTGDPAVIPAISASLGRLRPGIPVHVILAVDGPEDQQPLSSPADLRLTWLHTGGSAEAAEEMLLGAVRDLELPGEPGQAFVHGEAGGVRAIRRHLLTDRGVAPGALSASGYWKRSRTEEGWREDKAEWKRLAAQDERAAAAGPHRA